MKLDGKIRTCKGTCCRYPGLSRSIPFFILPSFLSSSLFLHSATPATITDARTNPSPPPQKETASPRTAGKLYVLRFPLLYIQKALHTTLFKTPTHPSTARCKARINPPKRRFPQPSWPSTVTQECVGQRSLPPPDFWAVFLFFKLF